MKSFKIDIIMIFWSIGMVYLIVLGRNVVGVENVLI